MLSNNERVGFAEEPTRFLCVPMFLHSITEHGIPWFPWKFFITPFFQQVGTDHATRVLVTVWFWVIRQLPQKGRRIDRVSKGSPPSFCSGQEMMQQSTDGYTSSRPVESPIRSALTFIRSNRDRCRLVNGVWSGASSKRPAFKVPLPCPARMMGS